MIVYNLSIKVSSEIHQDWVQWQKQEHIPGIMATGYFTGYKFFHLLEQDDPDAIIYIIQCFASSIKEYEAYINEEAPQLHKKAIEKWGDQFITFRTVMESVN
jgi:hypothetical protein